MPGLAVPAGNLAFSVTIFCLCASACIGGLTARRALFGYELGGRSRWPTFASCISLWLLYISLSYLNIEGYISM